MYKAILLDETLLTVARIDLPTNINKTLKSIGTAPLTSEEENDFAALIRYSREDVQDLLSALRRCCSPVTSDNINLMPSELARHGVRNEETAIAIIRAISRREDLSGVVSANDSNSVFSFTRLSELINPNSQLSVQVFDSLGFVQPSTPEILRGAVEYPTKIPSLDAIFGGGLHVPRAISSLNVLIEGDAGAGKTILALNIAVGIA